MIGHVLVDAGPLVAIASPRDQYHSVCVAQIQDVRPPMITSWAVVAEATWLLRREADSLENLCKMARESWLELPALGIDMLIWFGSFFKRYAKMAPQLADATLVYLAEHLDTDQVFTVDHRDFSIYRIGKNRAFRLLPEQLWSGHTR